MQSSHKDLIIVVLLVNLFAFFAFIFSWVLNTLGALIGLKKTHEYQAQEYSFLKESAYASSSLKPTCTGRLKRGEWDLEKSEWKSTVLVEYGIDDRLHDPFLKHFKYRTSVSKGELEGFLRVLKEEQQNAENIPAIVDFLYTVPDLSLLRDKIPLINIIRSIPEKECSGQEILEALPLMLQEESFGEVELDEARKYKAMYQCSLERAAIRAIYKIGFAH